MDSAIWNAEEERQELIKEASAVSNTVNYGMTQDTNNSIELKSSSTSEEVDNRRKSNNDTGGDKDSFNMIGFLSDNIDSSNEKVSSVLNDEQGNEKTYSYLEKTQKLINNLRIDMEAYTATLEELLESYSLMRNKTPDGIRQLFDLAFKEMKLMIQLQNKLNVIITSDNFEISKLAEAFQRIEFDVYKRYTVLANSLQRDIKSYSSYFQENFVDLASKIMVPTRKLNTYIEHLKAFLKMFCDDKKQSIQIAIAYLEELKQIANTEMTINVIQNCPVELRLSGIILHVGELHYEGDFLAKKLYYLIMFDSILVITENKFDYCTYRHYIRRSQLLDVTSTDNLRITLKVYPSYHQSDTILHKFRAVTKSDMEIWLGHIKNWKESNITSFENSILNRYIIPAQAKRFFPLSIDQISPKLSDVLKKIKNEEPLEATIKGSKGKTIFEQFMKQEKEYIKKLDVALDPESMPPPPLLGSILRKIRHFHKGSFQPVLKKAFERDPSSIIECVMGHLPNIPILYKEFIEIRAGQTLTMIDGENLRLYVSPFQQLSLYINWIHEVSCIPMYHTKLRGQVNILMNCVEDARVSLLHTAILNCTLDFYKAGQLIHQGTLESKIKSKNVKANQTYYVLLFEKVIVFTKLSIPYYEFVQVIWLDQLIIGPQTDCIKSFKLEERLYKKELIYDLKAETALRKTSWLEAITKLLNKYALDIRGKSVLHRVTF